jgi:hypothetical protein
MQAIAAPLTELIETLTYAPGLKGGTDLEAATKTISATSEPGAADYSSTHTITAPTDARIAVLRGCVRLSVTIDSFGGGGAVLNYRVKNGATSLSTGTLSTAASTGNKLVSFDITANITGAQTYTLFLWVDTGTCVISEVTFWSGVGSMQSGYTNPSLSLTYTGTVRLNGAIYRQGTGTVSGAVALASPIASMADVVINASSMTSTWFSSSSTWQATIFSSTVLYLYIYAPTVATDLPYLFAVGFAMRKLV